MNTFIELTDRHDRLGANITNYVATIFIALKNNYYIKYTKDKQSYKYANSIFIKCLFNFVDEYNKKRDKMCSIKMNKSHDYNKHIHESLIDIKCDYISFFKEHIYDYIKEPLYELALNHNYIIPFDCTKTILVHLRLDDVSNIAEYNTSVAVNHYKNIINNDIKEIENFPLGFQDGQSTLNENTIKTIIDKAKNIYNDCEIIIVTSPGSKHSFPYKTITSPDENYDLFLLCNSKVIIASRSSFSFAAIMFGKHSCVYSPLWGTIVLYGLNTKYDKSNVILF
jgi:hypothetical protein